MSVGKVLPDNVIWPCCKPDIPPVRLHGQLRLSCSLLERQTSLDEVAVMIPHHSPGMVDVLEGDEGHSKLAVSRHNLLPLNLVGESDLFRKLLIIVFCLKVYSPFPAGSSREN